MSVKNVLPVVGIMMLAVSAYAMSRPAVSQPAAPSSSSFMSQTPTKSTSETTQFTNPTGEQFTNPSPSSSTPSNLARSPNTLAPTPAPVIASPFTHQQTANGSTTAMPNSMNMQQFDNFVFNRWDANNDGTINRNEWNAINPNWFGTPLAGFNTADSNQNGIVEPSEVQNLFANNNQMFSFYDTNNDGVIDATEATRIPQ
jgi:hypothetical protein